MDRALLFVDGPAAGQIAVSAAMDDGGSMAKPAVFSWHDDDQCFRLERGAIVVVVSFDDGVQIYAGETSPFLGDDVQDSIAAARRMLIGGAPPYRNPELGLAAWHLLRPGHGDIHIHPPLDALRRRIGETVRSFDVTGQKAWSDLCQTLGGASLFAVEVFEDEAVLRDDGSFEVAVIIAVDYESGTASFPAALMGRFGEAIIMTAFTIDTTSLG